MILFIVTISVCFIVFYGLYKDYKTVKNLNNKKYIWLCNYWRNPKVELPNIDEEAIWIYENGRIFSHILDKDMDEECLKRFLKGYESTGPIMGWMPAPYVPEF